MNLLLLGKTGGITRWTEDLAQDLRLSGHAVTVMPTRNPWLHKSLERFLLSPAIGSPLAELLVRQMRRRRPDMVLAVGALDQFPLVLFQHLSAAKQRPPLIAWIGDIFAEHHAPLANLFDIVAYTDTGLLSLHNRFGFKSQGAYVPLGATRGTGAVSRAVSRAPELAFVAAPAANRRELLAQIADPVAIFGPGWQDANELAHHKRHPVRIDERELAEIYARHIGVLNIRNGGLVINGLNQRHFAPYIQSTPVITDAQPDIPHCFDPGDDILVYHDAAELRAIQARLRHDPGLAALIGVAGQRRVLAQHTYAHRLDTIAALAGIKPAGVKTSKPHQ